MDPLAARSSQIGWTEVFAYPLAAAVALFSALSALFHLLVASPLSIRGYRSELARHRNRYRWVEYSLSASLMIVLIAGISGITDIAALWSLFGLTAAMILFGWLMETTNQLGAQTGVLDALRDGLRRRCRSVAGAGSDVPNFVYGIFVSLFLLFNCFAVNQFLQYRRVGPWRNYHFGEAAYVVLSLVAKSPGLAGVRERPGLKVSVGQSAQTDW